MADVSAAGSAAVQPAARPGAPPDGATSTDQPASTNLPMRASTACGRGSPNPASSNGADRASRDTCAARASSTAPGSSQPFSCRLDSTVLAQAWNCRWSRVRKWLSSSSSEPPWRSRETQARRAASARSRASSSAASMNPSACLRHGQAACDSVNSSGRDGSRLAASCQRVPAQADSGRTSAVGQVCRPAATWASSNSRRINLAWRRVAVRTVPPASRWSTNRALSGCTGGATSIIRRGYATPWLTGRP